MGKDFALRLIQEGYEVYGAARRVEKMKDIEEAGGHAVALDITDEAMIEAAVNRIVDEQGRIDVLINNAGYGSWGAVEDVSLEEARRQFEVNLFGLARLTQLVLPYMRREGFGKIINISSVGGKIYIPLGAWYHATKHALEGWSDCLRFEVEPFGIDVVIIEPGGVETEFGDVMNEHLVQASENSAYKTLIEHYNRLMQDFGTQAAPRVITDLIVKALKAKKPKTRYSAGTMAKQILIMRRLLSDRMFDRMLRSMLKMK